MLSYSAHFGVVNDLKENEKEEDKLSDRGEERDK